MKQEVQIGLAWCDISKLVSHNYLLENALSLFYEYTCIYMYIW